MTDHDLKPMDPETLAELRSIIGELSTAATTMHNVPVRGWLIGELLDLLADRDYQEQRADAAERGEPNSWRLDTLRRLAGLPPDATWGACMVQLKRVERERDEARTEVARLRAEINTPHTVEFLDSVRIEAVHQRERWGTEHDAGKSAADWFWLLGYLAGKAMHADKAGDVEKLKHHIITSAAALANWYAQVIGADSRMRPGIDSDERNGMVEP